MTCCSIGAATVSATTFELAPGYVQLTCTVGGVISGYWATGRMKTAMLPISVMITEITAAKIGRLIKNLATSLTVRACYFAAASKPGACGADLRAEPAFATSLHSDQLAPARPRPFGRASRAAVPSQSRDRPPPDPR